MLKVGIIADTHGLLRPEALAALQGCARIIHAGDVGKPEVLEALRALAPVSAIRGNVDRGPWAARLPEEETLTLGGVGVHVLHDRAVLKTAPLPAKRRVVISGHSHQPSIEEKGGILWINPGSAGPRRFRLPITVARLEIDEKTATPRARLIALEPALDQAKK